jgi:UDP-glucose 4-epimerase
MHVLELHVMLKAVVFGGSGFLGSHVVDMLEKASVEVTIFDQIQSPYHKSHKNMILGDIRDALAVKAALVGQDYVLNFAGIAGLEEAREKPRQTAEANIIGNLNILEGMIGQPPQRYIFASTYYVYSEFGSIYRITKQSCELFIEDYAKRFGINYSILRYGSLYGERSNKSNAVYRLLYDALVSRRIVREGGGDDIREYVHVQDAARSTVEVMLKPEYSNQHVILAGQQKTRIRDLLEMIQEMMGHSVQVEYKESSKRDSDHYHITPYTFKPQTAFRYSGESYHDLGQGLLQMLYNIRDQISRDELKKEEAEQRGNQKLPIPKWSSLKDRELSE